MDLTYPYISTVKNEAKRMPDSPENVVYTSELSPNSLTATTATTLLTPFPPASGGHPPIRPRPVAKPFPTTSLPSATTGGGTKPKTALPSSQSSSSHKSISVVPNSSSNLSVVSGSVVLPPTILQTNNSGVLYHTGQGLVYATPANLPDGVVLKLGQEQGGSQQQFITIPVSLSLTTPQQQLVQAQVATSSPTYSSSSSGHTHKKPRK